MTWTVQENALWIRGSVQTAQAGAYELLKEAGATVPLPKDGKYSAEWHVVFRDAVVRAARGDGDAAVIETVARWDDQGPRGLFTLLPDVGEETARDVEVAWAFWQKLTGGAQGTRAEVVIADYNRTLVEVGNAPITPRAAAEFVAVEPVVPSSVWKTVLVLLGLGIVGFVGFRQGQSRCDPSKGLLETGRRWAGRGSAR